MTIFMVGQAYDALAAGKVEETKARLALLTVALEQASVDRGSWVLASELLFNMTEPPLTSMSARPPDPRFPFSRLCDQRWLEIAQSRLKDVDETLERRRKLMGLKPSQPASQHQEGSQEEGAGAGPRPKRAPKAKAKPE
jgi:hypothetical protein